MGRYVALGERDIGLRASWLIDGGFVNLSHWPDQVCGEPQRAQ
jgi:hypothetical protein